MKLSKRLKSLIADKKGNVLMLGAAAMPLLIGSAALAIDTIQLSLLRRHLQRAADSGALAGAYAKVQEEDIDDAVAKALTYNDAYPLASPAAVTEPSAEAVTVRLTAERSLAFWSFFGDPPTINVEATAALVFSGKYCMVSLDESTDTGIDFSGTGEVDLKCGVIANSKGNSAVSASGNGKVIASPVAAVGNITENPAADKGFLTPTIKLPYTKKQDDPYEDVPEPTLPVPCNDGPLDTPNNTTPVPKGPGCYSGSSVPTKGVLNLSEGTYYIKGAVDWQGKVVGEGVTIIFMDAPTLSINAQATIQLSPPDTGDYAGMIMYYHDPNPAQMKEFHINGGSTSAYTGGIYFPTHKLHFNGNATMNTTCIKIVAKKIVFNGTVKVENTCPGDEFDTKFDAEWVRLIA